MDWEDTVLLHSLEDWEDTVLLLSLHISGLLSLGDWNDIILLHSLGDWDNSVPFPSLEDCKDTNPLPSLGEHTVVLSSLND